MEEAEATQLQTIVQGAKVTESPAKENVNDQLRSVDLQLRSCKWWLQVAIYAVFVLAGQSAGTILGRLYFVKGGKSKWMATFVQTAGFPIVIPLLYFFPATKYCTQANNNDQPKSLSSSNLAAIYVLLGLITAGCCALFAYGLVYLPVSTFSLICASQLGFNAFFSFFINSVKLTPPIINSIALVTTSSILLVFQTDDSKKTSGHKYVIGFLCTTTASALYAFQLSLIQRFFQKSLQRKMIRQVLNVLVYPSFVATCVITVGVFGSGEWKSFPKEMEGFELGKSSYVLTLVWTALAWQIFSIGLLGLIFKISALFSNVISTVGLPIVPVLAVIIFHDKMSGIKVISLLLAIWGFLSYIYQHHLDDLKSREPGDNIDERSDISLVERG